MKDKVITETGTVTTKGNVMVMYHKGLINYINAKKEQKRLLKEGYNASIHRWSK